MRTIIAGGRDYHLTRRDFLALNKLRDRLPITLILNGCASGADSEGASWARSYSIPVEDHPADWARHGRAAGPIRNAEMVAVAEALIAFPGGRGTADVVAKARAAGLPVIIVDAALGLAASDQ